MARPDAAAWRTLRFTRGAARPFPRDFSARMAEKSLGNARAAPHSALVQQAWVLPLRGRARPPFARDFCAMLALKSLARKRRPLAAAQQAWVLPLRRRDC